MRKYARIAALILLTGCAHSHEAPDDKFPPMCGGVFDQPSDLAKKPPTFIEDDYPRALAEAKARHVPLFVDAWASWCHSCVSLKNYVFTDPQVAIETSNFVWLAIDTENPKNAAFVAKFPSAVLPTLRVVDATSETEKLKWEGTLTAAELVDTLEHLRYSTPIKDEASHARDVDAQVMTLSLAGENETCAKMASESIGKLPNGTQRVDVAVTGTSCAMELSKSEQQRFLPQLLDELQKITTDTSLPILADDRSGAFEALVDAGQAAGEKAASTENAARWATFLEGEANKAKTPAERAVFDPHRLLAYLALAQPERAIPMLQQSQKDFPNDFNPPARLARAYFEMGQIEETLTASDQALALATGPRRVKIALLKADALAKKGDIAAEQQTLDDTLTFVGTLPAAQVSKKMTSVLQDRIAKLEARTTPTGPGKKAAAKH